MKVILKLIVNLHEKKAKKGTKTEKIETKAKKRGKKLRTRKTETTTIA